MHKSKDITKYNIGWQIVRVHLKKFKDIDEKLMIASHFFVSNKTIDNKERVINWLEGLAMGYKAAKNDDAILKIRSAIISYELKEASVKEANRISTTHEMRKYSTKERKDLWEDLLKRNSKWLLKGYYQNEINEFMDNLYNSFESASIYTPCINDDYLALSRLRESMN